MGRLKLVGLIVAALAVPAVALAATEAATNNVTLPKGSTHTGTYYASGQTVTVDGDVTGDVVCAGRVVTINGSVGGDVLCAGQAVTVNGPVAGSVRAAGQVVKVNSTVGRNVTSAGQDVTLSAAAKVGGDVVAGGATVEIDGLVTGNLALAGDALKLGRDTHVAGNLDYASSSPLAIDRSKVGGQVHEHKRPASEHRETNWSVRIGMFLYWVVAGWIGLLLAVWLMPKMVRSVTNMMLRRWQSSLGWGLVALVGTPFVALLIAMTFVGLPTAGLVFGAWLIVLMTGGLFAGLAVGRLILKGRDDSRRALALAALAGLPIVVLVSWLPFLGVLVGFAMAVWALGGVVLALNRARTLG